MSTISLILIVACILLAAYFAAKENICGTVLNIGFAIINVIFYGINKIS
jgi:hypothetical protein